MVNETDMVTVDDAIKLLNELLELDRPAVATLIANHVPCNLALADHETVQCAAQHGGFRVGMLGILNGLFGTLPDGRGKIESVFEDSDDPADHGRKLVKFKRADFDLASEWPDQNRYVFGMYIGS